MQFATMPKQSSQTSRLTYTQGVKGGPPPLPIFGTNNKSKWVFNKWFKVYNSCLWWYPETSAPSAGTTDSRFLCSSGSKRMRRGLGPSKGPRLRWEELLRNRGEYCFPKRGHWFFPRENQWYYTCLASGLPNIWLLWPSLTRHKTRRLFYFMFCWLAKLLLYNEVF